jgi:hypothetical protein
MMSSSYCKAAMTLPRSAMSAVTEAVPAFTKPQSVEEREQLMALLGNVMAALQ